MSKKYQILKVRDTTDSYYTETDLADIPFRILINGRSQLSGKTTLILNLIANPDFPYHGLFDGPNIYVISNNKLDNKLKMLASRMEIPENNLSMFDEEHLDLLYQNLEEEFIEETKAGGKPANRLIIFDDCGYGNDLKNKQAGVVSRLICNGRHLNLSQIYTSQKYSQCSTTLRTNITMAILFGTSMKELDLIEQDMNYFETKAPFIKMFRKITREPRSFLAVNFSAGLDPEKLYLDSNFLKIIVDSN